MKDLSPERSLNLGGSSDLIPNAIQIAELAIDKQVQTLLVPLSREANLTICQTNYGPGAGAVRDGGILIVPA